MKENKKSVITWVVTAVVIVICAAVLLYFAGSGKLTHSSGSGSEISVGLSVTVGGSEVLYDEQITVHEGEALIDVMKANVTENGGVVYTNGDYGAYICSICGASEDPANSEYWVYTVNGEQAAVGASDYYPEDGDVIVFDLSELIW